MWQQICSRIPLCSSFHHITYVGSIAARAYDGPTMGAWRDASVRALSIRSLHRSKRAQPYSQASENIAFRTDGARRRLESFEDLWSYAHMSDAFKCRSLCFSIPPLLLLCQFYIKPRLNTKEEQHLRWTNFWCNCTSDFATLVHIPHGY